MSTPKDITERLSKWTKQPHHSYAPEEEVSSDVAAASVEPKAHICWGVLFAYSLLVASLLFQGVLIIAL